ncbi:hypothetical protein [Paraburkholderia saeva]|uniref:hypothetical protein n=1 Tax=Paraburkholderia saeva TaxID=2777537 RepID=UPI001D2C96CF|nr:hypothetical protein [Paraburkholderia saeva]CAG4888061.1 hypothetical protein R52603_00568 [Paraburkholderia saeva]
MTTILIALVSKFWPVIVGVLGMAGGILFGWVKTKSAATTTAQAGQKVAEAQQTVADNQNAEAQANAAAAQAGMNATKEANDAHNDVDALPAGTAAQQLLDQWSRPGEDAGRGGAGSAGQDPNR